MDIVSITDIESSINFYIKRQPPAAHGVLGPEVRVLAEVYGLMIFERRRQVERSYLKPETLSLIEAALGA